MSEVPLADRLVEVIADRGAGSTGGRFRYGSGCIVRGRTVLTAAHVLEGAVKVAIRDPDKREFPAIVDPRFVADSETGPDLALLEIDDPAIDRPPLLLARLDRDSPTGEPVERCHALGYPWFAETPSRSAVRETVDAIGVVPTLSKLVRGWLSVQVSVSAQPLPQDGTLAGSQWSGMSGGPVVADGFLLGVVVEHAPREGPSSITAVPLTALEADPAHPGWGSGVPDAGAWWDRLGAAGLSDLRLLPPRSTRGTPPYRDTLRTFGSGLRKWKPQLSGRERELADIAAFATGPAGYRWLVGEPFAGKTALLYEAVTAGLPSEVDTVCYFLSLRGSDANSSRFLSVTVKQLAYLCEVELPAVNPDDLRDQFTALWRQASERARTTGRPLVLVVDGLDEDSRPAGFSSVASLLPAVVEERTHVLVASRASWAVPFDVPPSHPLRTTTPVRLEPSTEARELEGLARQEIDVLTHGPGADLGIDVLGLLAAAGGPLSVEDLATLSNDLAAPSPADRRRVRRLVTEDAARSLEAVESASPTRYRFAHRLLLHYARDAEDLADPEYSERLDRWADRWRDRGWPIATPRYLLDEYPDRLRDTRPQRLRGLASDLEWIAAALQVVGVDQVLLSLTLAASQQAAVGGRRGRYEDTSVPGLLRREIVRSASMLTPMEPAGALRATVASRLDRVRGLEQLVESYARSLPIPRLENWRALPDQSDPALVQTLPPHADWIRCCAFSPDGGMLASADDDGMVTIWEPANNYRRIDRFEAHEKEATACTFSPAGDLLVTGHDDGAVWLRPTKEGTAPRKLAGHSKRVWSCAFSRDGALLATGGDDKTARVWEVATGRLKATIDCQAPVWDVAFRADSTSLLTAAEDGAVWSWDVESRQGGQVLHWLDLSGGVCAFSARAELVAMASAEGVIRIWDTRTGESRALRRPGLVATSCAFSAAGEQLAVAGQGDNAIRVWDTATGELHGIYRGHSRRVRTCAFSPDSAQLATGGEDRVVRIWSTDTTSAGTTAADHDDWVRCCAFSADGALVATASDDGTARVWDARTGERRAVLTGHRDWLRCCALSPDGSLVATASDDGTAGIWDAGTGERLLVLTGHDDWVRCCAFSPDGGVVVTGGDDGAARTWDAGTGEPLGLLGGSHSWVSACSFSPDGGSIVTGAFDGVVRIYDLASQHSPKELAGHEGPVFACSVSPDGAQLVTASADKTVRTWNLRTGRGGLLPHPDWVRGCAFSSDGTRIVTVCDDRTVRIWDAASEDCITALRVAEPLLGCAWQPGGNLIYAGGHAGMYGFRLLG